MLWLETNYWTSVTHSRKNVTQPGLRWYLCNCLWQTLTHIHAQMFQWQWGESEGSLRSVSRLMSGSLQSRKPDCFVVIFIPINLGQEQLSVPLLHCCRLRIPVRLNYFSYFSRNQRLYVALIGMQLKLSVRPNGCITAWNCLLHCYCTRTFWLSGEQHLLKSWNIKYNCTLAT